RARTTCSNSSPSRPAPCIVHKPKPRSSQSVLAARKVATASRKTAARDRPLSAARLSSHRMSSSGRSARMRAIDIPISNHDIASTSFRFALLPLHGVVKAIGPTWFHQLLRAHHAQFALGDIAANGASRGHDRIRSNPHGSDQRTIRADERPWANLRLVLEVTVVIAGNSPCTDVCPCPDSGVPQVSQVVRLGACPEHRLLHLHEIADL